MLIDNFSSDLLARLVCPISREALIQDGNVLRTSSGFAYPNGDFRAVAGDMSLTDWGKGQRHYEEYNRSWLSRDEAFYQSSDKETIGLYREIPLTGDVLDVGGGFGLVTVQAALDPSKIVCIDPMVCLWDRLPASPYKTHYAKLSAVTRIPGYAEHLPFPNATFDTVHMRSCLDHFANPHRALLEARRVLKPKGKLVVGLAMEGAFKLDHSGFVNVAKRKLKESVIGDIYERFFDQHMFHPTEESLRALLSGAGFQIDQWILQKGYSGVVYLSATRPAQALIPAPAMA